MSAREWAGRIGLALVGLALGLVLLETALQAAALVLRASGREFSLPFVAEGQCVLAVGDSNTYGLYVEPAQAYPKVFQQLWNARHPESPIEVVNVGFPGTNSSRLRNALPRFLEAAKPAVVTIMVGANDFWTEPETVSDPSDPSATVPVGGGASWLWRHSRVYRLLFMARRTAAVTLEQRVDFKEGDDPPGEGRGRFQTPGGPIELGWGLRQKPPDASFVEGTRRNLIAIAELARQHGVEPVFVTYPSERGAYGVANEWIRGAAAETGSRLIDIGAALRQRCPDDDCRELFFRDQHPTVRGHATAAEVLLGAWDREGS